MTKLEISLQLLANRLMASTEFGKDAHMVLQAVEELRELKYEVRDWLACSPLSERIGKRRCEELLEIVNGDAA